MKWIDDFEAHYDYDCSYIREMAKSSPDGFKTFEGFLPMGSYSKTLSKNELWVAKISSMLTEDCGACVQLNIKMAIEAGVDISLIKTIIQAPENLEDDLQLIYEFAKSVSLGSETFTDLQAQVSKKYSSEQLTEMAIAISSVKIYPTIKRALGYFKSCSLYTYTF